MLKKNQTAFVKINQRNNIFIYDFIPNYWLQ